MRLAYLYSRYPVVSQTFCDSEMLALEALGFDLEIVSLNPPPDSFRHERLDRLKAEMHYPSPGVVLDAKVRAPEFQDKLGPLVAEHDAKYGGKFKAAMRARNAWHFAPLLRKLGVKHVHVHFANRATHTALFLKKLGFTFSFTAHAQDFMVDLGSDDLLREMAREAEFVIGVSDYSCDLLAQICAESAAKITRIYNGIELNDFPRAQPERGGVLRIVSVGRLIEFKGFMVLLDAVTELNRRGVSTDTRIIGEGPARVDLEQMISAHGLLNVTLLGVRSQRQIQRELAEANVFVLPSIVDHKGACDILPTVITEAMACRLPVVSTRVSGIPEMVLHGETGLLVEPGDDHALADAIMELSVNPARRQAMGEAGRIHAEKNFSIEVTVPQLASRFHSKESDDRRAESPVVYLINQWNGETTQLDALHDEPRLRVIACSCSDNMRQADAQQLDQIEFLPDAVVLESHWLRQSGLRHRLERARSVLGESVSGEEFYQQARRAVYLADALPRRGVKHLHAFRSDAVLCVWLVNKLTGMSVSAAIEEQPATSRALLARLLVDFEMVSNSDKKLGGDTGLFAKDALSLNKPVTHRELRFGPLRLRLRKPALQQDRSQLERDWFQLILQNLNA
ncbi:MAG: glycosyltransferase family 4 protein [Verrucomicrobia bacterium]|nr:glycosyltransferase family 4 protein [Verrucomicrobiota bacterium]